MNKPTWALTLMLACGSPLAQVASFDIQWRTLAIAESNAPGQRPKVERSYARLPPHAASEFRIERVAATPEVMTLRLEQTFCLSSLDLRAIDAAGQRVSGVRMSIDVKADDLPGLRLLPNKQDVCFKPVAPGEYPIRFTSLVPARDATSRGAQMFIRVQPQP